MCGLFVQVPEKYQGVKGKMSSLQRGSWGGAWEGNAAPSICSEHGAGAAPAADPGPAWSWGCSGNFLWELLFQGMSSAGSTRQLQAIPATSTSAGNAEEAPSEPSWNLGRAVPAEGEIRDVQGENSHKKAVKGRT